MAASSAGAGDGRSAARARKLIVIADPHIRCDGGTIIGIDPQARLAAAVAHINRHHGDADLVVLLGDLVDDGEAGSYALLRQTIAPLTAPVAMLLGNHDWRASFRGAFPEVAVDGHGFVQARRELGDWVLLLLDTLVENQPHGEICERRAAWLARELDAAGDRPVLLFLHHPPMISGFPGMDAIRLARPDALRDLIRNHGNVCHIFAGHIHRTIAGSWAGIPFSIFKSLVHQQPMDLDACDASLSVAEPAAYGIVLLARDSIVVHTDDYEIADAAAGRTSSPQGGVA